MARSKMRQKNYHEALLWYENYAQYGKYLSSTDRKNIVKALTRENRHKEAYSVLTKKYRYLTYNKRNTWLATSLALKNKEYKMAAKYLKAKNIPKSILSKEGKYYWMGKTALARGDVELAKKYFTKVSKNKPEGYYSLLLESYNLSILPEDLDFEIEDDVELDYPKHHQNYVESMSKNLGVSENLIYSIMRAESGFNTGSESGVGAKGLMQLMPYTAIKISEVLDDDSFTMENLSDPKLNITYASFYIRLLLSHYDGNPILATAAYNAGPKKVDAWISDCGSCSIDEFIESIPYNETRLYVKKVFSNYNIYNKVYGNDTYLAQADLELKPKYENSNEDLF